MFFPRNNIQTYEIFLNSMDFVEKGQAGLFNGYISNSKMHVSLARIIGCDNLEGNGISKKIMAQTKCNFVFRSRGFLMTSNFFKSLYLKVTK